MAYAYTPTNADAAAVAARIAVATNAITGTPALTPPIVNPDFQAFISALTDSLLDCLSYRAQNDQNGAPGYVHAGGGWVNVFASWTAAVPVTKTYLLHVDTSAYMTVAMDSVTHRLLVDGAPVATPANAMRFTFNALADHKKIPWRMPLALTAGNRVLQLQWNTVGGLGTLNADANDCLCMTLSG